MGSSTFPFFVFSYLRPWRAPVYYSQKPSKCHPKNEAAYSLFSWPHGIHQTSEKRNTLYIFFQPYFLTLFRVSSDLDQKAYGFRFPTVAWRDHNQSLGQIFWEALGEKITIIIHLLGDPGPTRPNPAQWVINWVPFWGAAAARWGTPSAGRGGPESAADGRFKSAKNERRIHEMRCSWSEV